MVYNIRYQSMYYYTIHMNWILIFMFNVIMNTFNYEYILEQ